MDTFYHEVFATTQSHPIQLLIHQRAVNYVVLEHWHKELELNYFLENSHLGPDAGAVYWVNGKKFFTGLGSVTLVNSGDIHALEPNRMIENRDNRVLGASLFISYDFMKSICPDIDNIAFTLEGSPDQIARLKELFHELIQLRSDADEKYNHLRVTAVALQIVYILLTYFAHSKNKDMIHSQKYIDRLTKVMDYMKEHHQEPLTLHEVAEHFCISEQYLSRVFKTYTGHTFKQYLSKIRLEIAYRDVIRSDYSMMEIAMRSGFPDVRSFISIFKSTYGMPPMRYRKEYACRANLENPPPLSAKPFVRTLDG